MVLDDWSPTSLTEKTTQRGQRKQPQIGVSADQSGWRVYPRPGSPSNAASFGLRGWR